MLDKTERIREDCRVLMAGEGGSTKAGSVRHAIVSSLYFNIFLMFVGWKL